MSTVTVCKKRTISTLLTSSFLTLILLFALNNPCDAHVTIGIGTQFGPDVAYVPGHWEQGYWVPGQYVEYAGPQPGPGFIWVEGNVGGGGHWHGGHWGHHHHH